MNKCRIFFLIVQLICTSLVAAPLQYLKVRLDGDPATVEVNSWYANSKGHRANTTDHITYATNEIAPATDHIANTSNYNKDLVPQFRSHQLRADDLYQEIIIPLNSDLGRSRISVHNRLFQPGANQPVFSSLKN